MDSSCQFHKFGYCKLKDNCERVHVREECTDGLHFQSIKTCSLRHPKKCRRIVLEGLCGFGKKCAYNHKRRSHGQSVNDDDIREEVHKLKIEVAILKSTIR